MPVQNSENGTLAQGQEKSLQHPHSVQGLYDLNFNALDLKAKAQLSRGITSSELVDFFFFFLHVSLELTTNCVLCVHCYTREFKYQTYTWGSASWTCVTKSCMCHCHMTKLKHQTYTWGYTSGRNRVQTSNIYMRVNYLIPVSPGPLCTTATWQSSSINHIYEGQLDNTCVSKSCHKCCDWIKWCSEWWRNCGDCCQIWPGTWGYNWNVIMDYFLNGMTNIQCSIVYP